MNYRHYEKVIEKAMKRNGRFSHNIISIALREVAKLHGNESANELIDKYKLTDIFGIKKVKDGTLYRL